jgi:hypothetical protein
MTKHQQPLVGAWTLIGHCDLGRWSFTAAVSHNVSRPRM